MKTVILERPDMVREARNLLWRLTEENGSKKWKGDRKDLGIPRDEWKEMFDLVERIVKKGEKVFRKDMELIREYFTLCPVKEDEMLRGVVPGDFALLYIAREYDLSLGQIRKNLEEASEAEKYRKAYRVILADESEEPQKEVENIQDLMQILDGLTMESADKWNILKIVISPQEHFERIAPLLERAQELILEFQDQWQPMVEQLAENWKRVAEEPGVEGFLSDCWHITFQDNPCGIVVIPGIISLNSFSYGEFVPYHTPNILRVGLMFDSYEHMYALLKPQENSAMEKEYLMQALKCFGDKSKLEILTLLKQNRMYASELAEKLKLTNATISHHMNTLLVLNLISLELKENRSYYRLNSGEIRRILNELEKRLL